MRACVRTEPRAPFSIVSEVWHGSKEVDDLVAALGHQAHDQVVAQQEGVQQIDLLREPERIEAAEIVL